MDDGIGIEYKYEEAMPKSEFVQQTLTKSGFIHNIQKSTWEPCKIHTCVVIDIKLSSGTFKITKSRIDNILNTIYFTEDICFGQNFGKTCWTIYFSKILNR